MLLFRGSRCWSSPTALLLKGSSRFSHHHSRVTVVTEVPRGHGQHSQSRLNTCLPDAWHHCWVRAPREFFQCLQITSLQPFNTHPLSCFVNQFYLIRILSWLESFSCGHPTPSFSLEKSPSPAFLQKGQLSLDDGDQPWLYLKVQFFEPEQAWERRTVNTQSSSHPWTDLAQNHGRINQMFSPQELVLRNYPKNEQLRMRIKKQVWKDVHGYVQTGRGSVNLSKPLGSQSSAETRLVDEGTIFREKPHGLWKKWKRDVISGVPLFLMALHPSAKLHAYLKRRPRS